MLHQPHRKGEIVCQVWNDPRATPLRGHWRPSLVGGTHCMSKRDDYLDNAAQTLHLANSVSPLGHKSHLVDLAEKWLDLADRLSISPPTPSTGLRSIR